MSITTTVIAFALIVGVIAHLTMGHRHRAAAHRARPMTAAERDAMWEVLSRARDLAARYRHTPDWQERLTPEARRLVEAVLELDRASAVSR